MLGTILGFLRDPIFATILGIVSLLISLRRKNKGRRLRWAIVSDTRLLDMEELKIDIERMPEFKLLDGARIVTIQMWNDGDTSIPPESIYRPITVDFIGAEVIDVKSVEINPGDPTVQVIRHKSHPSKFTIKKALLNPGATISLVCSLLQSERSPSKHSMRVEATIDGVAQIKSGLPDQRKLVIQGGIAAFIALIAVLGIANDPAAAIVVTESRLFNLFYVMMSPVIITLLNIGERRSIRRNAPLLAVHNRYMASVWLTFISLAALYWVSVPAH